MKKIVKGKKVHISNILITFETGKGQVTLKEPAIAIRPVDNWIIKGAKYPNPVIEVFFENIPSYPIGYFRNTAARDSAMRIIERAKNLVRLNYEVFFKPHRRSQYELTKLFGVKPFPLILEYKMREIRQNGLDFVATWNSHSTTQLTSLTLKELRKGVLPPEIPQSKFVVDLLLFFSLKRTGIEKKLIKNEISPIEFWNFVIYTLSECNDLELREARTAAAKSSIEFEIAAA